MDAFADAFLKDLDEDLEDERAGEEREEKADSPANPAPAETVDEQPPANRLSDETLITLINSLKDTEDTTCMLPRLQEVNRCLQTVDAEILEIFQKAKELYSRRFPELETIILSPLDYLFVMRQLGNTLVVANESVLSERLSNQAALAVSVAASVSIGSPISSEMMDQLNELADRVDKLVEMRTELISYLERSMAVVAPNLTAIVGPAIAARLTSHAGGLKNLATMPSQNLMVVGGSSYARRTAAITSNPDSNLLPAMARLAGQKYGVIYECDLVQSTPAPYRARALHLIAGKSALAVRKDVYDNDGSSTLGRQLRLYIVDKLKKAQTPAPPTLKKPLPIPEEQSNRARRGGRRKRKWKEKYGMTEVRKKANRLLVTIDAAAQPERLQNEDDDDDDVF